jgi:hypothetical protein
MLIGFRRGVAGQQIENAFNFFTDFLVAREQADVAVNFGGTVVVVARAQMAITTQRVVFAAHDEAELAMRLQALQSENNMNAGISQLACPADIASSSKRAFNSTNTVTCLPAWPPAPTPRPLRFR